MYMHSLEALDIMSTSQGSSDCSTDLATAVACSLLILNSATKERSFRNLEICL